MKTNSLLYVLPTLAGAAPAVGSIQWDDCRSHLPMSSNISELLSTVTTLPESLHCGRIVVPMDYERNLGPDNNITLGLAMYRPRKPKGAIFL